LHSVEIDFLNEIGGRRRCGGVSSVRAFFGALPKKVKAEGLRLAKALGRRGCEPAAASEGYK
jgi:hypothetical protein